MFNKCDIYDVSLYESLPEEQMVNNSCVKDIKLLRDHM